MDKWYKERGARFLWERARKLLRRYDLSPGKALRRIDNCVDALSAAGCAPTFPTPGIVVQRYPHFMRHLQDAGAEIAVHSYQHIDLSALPVAEARLQLERAVETFERVGLEARGFRCPYLGYSEELREALPPGMFEYSSNEMIACQPKSIAGVRTEFSDRLRRLYAGQPMPDALCLPRTLPNLVEIPVCAPDDLELIDGLRLGQEETGDTWASVLDELHRLGELFTLMFHPELASLCEHPLEKLLDRASRCHPPVWAARLGDISAWWREKSGFGVKCVESPEGLRVAFDCTPRATILVRGLAPGPHLEPWDGAYSRLLGTTLDAPDGPRPFVGLPASAPEPMMVVLREQGYILDTSGAATRCAVWLDPITLSGSTPRQIVDRIEASTGPLVRYWRWPNGAKSALSITGDLDALTLLDYAGRLLSR
jgi:peptidoglycan/xylan/chitin deacetylase (PgdA/CDA1 family)